MEEETTCTKVVLHLHSFDICKFGCTRFINLGTFSICAVVLEFNPYSIPQETPETLKIKHAQKILLSWSSPLATGRFCQVQQCLSYYVFISDLSLWSILDHCIALHCTALHYILYYSSTTFIKNYPYVQGNRTLVTGWMEPYIQTTFCMLHDAISLGELVRYKMSFKRLNMIKSNWTFWMSCATS